MEGHFAADDDFFPARECLDLAGKLRDMGKNVVFHVYPGTGHAFGNWEDPLGTYDERAWNVAWSRAVAFLRGSVR